MASTLTFSPIATGGLGHPGSVMAGAITQFRGKIFLGSAAPTSTKTEDRARIHALEPKTGVWKTVFESPLLPASQAVRDRAAWLGSGFGGGRQRSEMRTEVLAAAQGITSFAVFQGRSDRAPCLYAATMSVRGARILRSEDGRRFQPVSSPGLGDDRVFAIRELTVWGGRLYALPVGMTTEEALDRVYPPEALIAVTDDPAADAWQMANTPGFGDAANIGISAMLVSDGALFAATANAARGFQLWRLYEPDGEWQQVMKDGAERFSPNLMVSAMTDFRGDIYLGTGIPGFGYDTETDTGPAAGEVIRLRLDGGWDLVAGDQRFTADGLKRPLSGLPAGFGNRYNAASWSMAVHGKRLFIGTHNWQANDAAADPAAAGVSGGFELWSSANGRDWIKELDQGGGASLGAGVRCMFSAPQGLLLGTLNQTRVIRDQMILRGLPDALADAAEGFDVLMGQ